jgi:predicted house-cleaning noncanonical NTP pyrophosphatase (MazG superfamily)
MKVKLVRDKLSQVIPAQELRKETDPQVLARFLRLKFNEEYQELKDSDYNDINEFADCIEVLLALAKQVGYSQEAVEEARQRKLQEKGGFEDGLIWSSV